MGGEKPKGRNVMMVMNIKKKGTKSKEFDGQKIWMNLHTSWQLNLHKCLRHHEGRYYEYLIYQM